MAAPPPALALARGPQRDMDDHIRALIMTPNTVFCVVSHVFDNMISVRPPPGGRKK